ncbi:MAG: NAD(P)-binding domain-containing protein [Acidobacteria bacterium]|nr:NAD(P)-binding domain-containing protein [Acidobacteriota bacterium]
MTTETIAIIGGTGDQGRGLALRWAKAGYAIIIGSRDAARAAAAAEEMRAELGGVPNITGLANAEAAAQAAIVVLAVPFAAQTPTLKTRVLGVWAGSAAEQTAELAPAGVEVVAAFHNVGADALSALAHEVECDILVCGDKKDAKLRLRPLVEAIPGCRYVDAGVLANARIVEAMTALLIGVNIRYKTHTGIRVTGLPA